MVKTFNTTKNEGVMSERKKYYNSELTKLEIEKDLLKRRIELGKKMGFDGTKILIPTPNDIYKYGKSVDVTDVVKEILSSDSNYDLWNLDIGCDIMTIKTSIDGIVLASPSNDCPVVVASTKDAFGIANCTAIDIDKELPIKLVDEIQKMTNAKTSEIEVYIGPCAGNGYEYFTYSRWAKNDLWKYTIIRCENGYKINLRKTIMLELFKRGVKIVSMSSVDTITNSDYYSHYTTINNIENKSGRILVGAYNDKVKKIK